MTRYVYIALIVLLAGVVLLFKVQNTELVTVSLFTMRLTVPTWLLFIGIYVLGLFTGGFVLALLRSLSDKARNG